MGAAVVHCVTDNIVDARDAQSRVNAAYLYRLDVCKQGPAFPLIIPHDVAEADLGICETDLLSARCPLTRMPAGCALLFLKKAKHEDMERRF